MTMSLIITSFTAKVGYGAIRILMVIWKFSKSKLEQEYYTFRILKRWGFTSLNKTFKSIYFHSLYSLTEKKSDEIIQLFAIDDVYEAFEKQLTQGTDWSFKTALIGNLHTNHKVRSLKSVNVNIQEELNEFTEQFRLHTNKARSPGSLEQLDLTKKTYYNSQGILDQFSRLQNDLNPQVNPLLVSEYVQRSEEEKVLAILESNDILLLSGISFCGKSQLARKISEKLVESGYRYLASSDLGEAERFLRNTSELRVLLLDDPFGHNSESEDSTLFRKVEELITNLRTPNKLIITSRSDVLKSIKSTTSLNDCSIKGNNWIDLTNTDRNFLMKTWGKLCEKTKVSQAVFELVKDYLNNHDSEDILQVGQLNHLSNIDNEKLERMAIDDLLHHAMADSNNIGVEIQKRSNQSFEIFITLGLGATTNIPIKYEEIGYILSESKNRHGYIEQTNEIQIRPKENNKDEMFPKYSDNEEFHLKFLEELGFLQTRGFIEISNRTVWFTHPTYREAARYILFTNNVDKTHRFDRILGKTLSSLNPVTAINCAKQLRFIYNNTESEALKEIIKRHANDGAWFSIFPGVRDICFSFLLEILDEISVSRRERLLGRLQNKFTNSDIKWHDDIPFISPKNMTAFDDFKREISKDAIFRIIEQIDTGKEVSTNSIWSLLIYLQGNNSDTFPSPKGIIHILNSAEAFIRNKIAFITLKKHLTEDDRIVDAIFNDNHPSVVFEGVKGAMLGFPEYSKIEQKKILPYLKHALEDPFVVIRANNVFSTFGIDYGSESIRWKSIDKDQWGAIWELWGELFPLFLNKYPKNLRFGNSGRFGLTLEYSVKYLNSKQGLAICEAYYGWVVKYLHNNLPDTYEFGVMPYLLKIITDKKKLRLNLFKRIFSHPDTNLIAYSLKWCLIYWNEVTEEEKEYVLKLLKSDREDLRWLQSTSLTQDKVPGEIQELIFGCPNHFDQDIETIVKSFERQLLIDSLTIFCGHSQVIYRLGLHSQGTEIWSEIIKWILSNEYSIGFEICLKEMLGKGVNGFTPEWEKDGLELWKELCQVSKNKKCLAERLILETSSSNCELYTTKKLWEFLIKGYGSNIEELAIMVSEQIEPLQSYNPEDIIEFFNREFLYNHILPKLKLDKKVFELWVLIKEHKINSIELIEPAIENLLKINEKERLKLDISFKLIDLIIRENGSEFPVVRKLSMIVNSIQETANSMIEEIDEYYEMENWNSVYLASQANK